MKMNLKVHRIKVEDQAKTGRTKDKAVDQTRDKVVDQTKADWIPNHLVDQAKTVDRTRDKVVDQTRDRVVDQVLDQRMNSRWLEQGNVQPKEKFRLILSLSKLFLIYFYFFRTKFMNF